MTVASIKRTVFRLQDPLQVSGMEGVLNSAQSLSICIVFVNLLNSMLKSGILKTPFLKSVIIYICINFETFVLFEEKIFCK